MKFIAFLSTALCFLHLTARAQLPVDLSGIDRKSGVQAQTQGEQLTLRWPAGASQQGELVVNLAKGEPLLERLSLGNKAIATALDPVFLLTVGQRDLTKRGGWDIFFDETAYRPSQTYPVTLDKQGVEVTTDGTRTKVQVAGASAGPFSGAYEITLYNGSPLLNLAAVLSTPQDSLAILYDAGLVGTAQPWEKIAWADPDDLIRSHRVAAGEAAQEKAVKYRTIIGQSASGSVAVFPPPHQYFYPLDNCYNLKHTWFGTDYREMTPGYGLGIRHDPLGDRRWVPWFNAPPGTAQRLNFFCLLSTEKDGKALDAVKAFTHDDTYRPLPGYYTMSSHFHQEHSDDVLTHKPLPDMPGFVETFRRTGVNIVHLGEFHGPGSPRGPEAKRWPELQTEFAECARLSDGNFLLLPGEEPNNFFGGHWMNLFPKPVYWLMDRAEGQPFVEELPPYGKVYRIKTAEEMLRLLEAERGLAWTAHARIKGSTGFPDGYKDKPFYASDRFLGAAWKAMPADLSQPRLGRRVLDLMDDMANWGLHKYVIAEADLFRIEPSYELYGHLNVNYLQLDQLPAFEEGWQPVLDAMERGKFFVSTGEVLLPTFTVNGVGAGETASLDARGRATLTLEVDWTYPLQFLEIISGDGENVYRETISLTDTEAFGHRRFQFTPNLKNRTWVRVEVWDAAVNGAFTQPVWLK
ncbi:hypothetical protein SAMN05421823_102146 [Catalinimonas alkaloidigena]|uniref:Uncharacterized protein n=1 Tax=Catalinimonas alkaloidigena TaxID=1075417 RepID=A0A1G9A0G6_9BACT|nr:hypothetical protein [Catalinimonas alkaloidigena]SDK20869.1 hypothetical protein SAMN05421823_102146 [Catalinimonas alkaloidigena]